MFVAVDNNDNILGLHESQYVVNTFVENYMKSNEDKDLDIKIVEIKKKRLIKESKDAFFDMYLIPHMDTYIPRAYIDTVNFCDDNFIYDELRAKDVLGKILELRDLSKREKRILTKAYLILEDFITEDAIYTPSINNLKSMQRYIDDMIVENEYSSSNKYYPL